MRSPRACAIVVMMGRAFVIPIVAILGGCHIVFPIEPIDPHADAGPDSTPPRVFSSPSPAADVYGGYAQALPITLGADDPSTIIYYTMDGSEPDLLSTSSITPITGIAVTTISTLRYFGVNAAGRGPAATEIFTVDGAAVTKAGYVVTGTTLDGTSPVVVAKPGDVLTARTNLQIWVQSICPLCQAQLVYGIDTVDQGCLYDDAPGVHPGVMKPDVTFTVNVPTTTTPGVHEVRVAHIEELSCAMAMAMGALLTRPTGVRIGAIVVR